MKEFRSTHATGKSKHDQRVIEAAVFRFGPVSRVNIRELTHLHPTTISHRVRELLAAGRLLEAGFANNSMGRKQVLLRLNEQRGFVVGVGFDDEFVLAGTMDLHPTLRSQVRQTTELKGGPEEFEKQLLACTRQAIKQARVDVESILAIGVAGSGLMNSREGTLAFSSTVGVGREIHLKQIFEKELGIPTFVEHLGRTKAVAEKAFGAGAGAKDMIYLEYGRTGIGAGIIINGQLVYGCGSAAGEIGHTHVLEDGPVCKCGSFGCLEAIAGAAALATRMRKAIADGSVSEALMLAGGDVNKISGFTVLEAARMGDKTFGSPGRTTRELPWPGFSQHGELTQSLDLGPGSAPRLGRTGPARSGGESNQETKPQLLEPGPSALLWQAWNRGEPAGTGVIGNRKAF